MDDDGFMEQPTLERSAREIAAMLYVASNTGAVAKIKQLVIRLGLERVQSAATQAAQYPSALRYELFRTYIGDRIGPTKKRSRNQRKAQQSKRPRRNTDISGEIVRLMRNNKGII